VGGWGMSGNVFRKCQNPGHLMPDAPLPLLGLETDRCIIKGLTLFAILENLFKLHLLKAQCNSDNTSKYRS